MSLPRLGALKLRRDAAGAVRFTSAPDRTPLTVRATTALAELARRAEAPGAGRVVDVQPLVQVSDAAGYHRWRSEREAAWRAQGGRFTTSGWPRALAEDRLAAVLLPLPYGTTAAGGRRGPRVIADPLFSTRSLTDGSSVEDLALGLVAQWLSQATSGATVLRVAPPLLEHDGARRVLDLGLAWPLAASPS